MPDQMGRDCPDHPQPGYRCFCDETRDLAVGIHRPGGVANAFGGYHCICGDTGCPGSKSSPVPARTNPAWQVKYRRYLRAGKIADIVGWLLVLAGLVAPSVTTDRWLGLLLCAVGFGLIGFSWRLHRIAGMAQAQGLHVGEDADNG